LIDLIEMKKTLALLLLGRALGTDFDYCSIQHSQLAADDIKGYFMEVFKEFGVPVSQSCPFA
jgi:hypothetical protein